MTEIQKREFEFELPEDIKDKSPEEIREFIKDDLLAQHEDFVAGAFKGHIKPEDFNTKFEEETTKRAQVAAELKENKEKANTIASSLVEASKVKALMKIAGLTDEDIKDETVVKQKLESAFEENKSIFTNPNPIGLGGRIIIDNAQVKTKKRRFVKGK